MKEIREITVVSPTPEMHGDAVSMWAALTAAPGKIASSALLNTLVRQEQTSLSARRSEGLKAKPWTPRKQLIERTKLLRDYATGALLIGDFHTVESGEPTLHPNTMLDIKIARRLSESGVLERIILPFPEEDYVYESKKQARIVAAASPLSYEEAFGVPIEAHIDPQRPKLELQYEQEAVTA